MSALAIVEAGETPQAHVIRMVEVVLSMLAAAVVRFDRGQADPWYRRARDDLQAALDECRGSYGALAAEAAIVAINQCGSIVAGIDSHGVFHAPERYQQSRHIMLFIARSIRVPED